VAEPTGAGSRRVLVLCSAAPYADSRMREALDVALAFGAFEQRVELLFSGDGVLALLPRQAPTQESGRSVERLLGTLPDYGIEAPWVDTSALARRGIDTASLGTVVRYAEPALIRDLLATHDVILTV
jgi:tRNA 2-thiouridine synthesizing protein C